ncbi:MAG: hypothetical protein O2968_01735 [Acidobacteria bacterium]|nr:hypothetical protein [Acidobacteriota bacterium]
MNALNSRWSLAAAVLVAMIAVSTPLAAAQKGPSRTKMPPLSAEQQAASKDKAKQVPKKETQRTPFGETKRVPTTADTAPAAATSPYIEVEEKGDTIVFQRRSPFGLQTWRKKRSELTPEDEEMLRAHQAKQSADSAPDSAKLKTKPAAPEAAPGGAQNAAGQDREKR